MFSFFIFILSGVAILSLTLAKRFEMKSSAERRKIFLLRAVSRGDEQARHLYHKSLHLYSEGKVKAVFFLRKQLPVRIKIYANKGYSWVEERFVERFGDMRNSRFIKRQEGISDFFKSISEVEKGGGELHDDVYEEKEEILAYRITPITAEPVPQPEAAPAPEAVAANISITEEVSIPKPKKPRAPRKPRAKKVKVLEVSEY